MRRMLIVASKYAGFYAAWELKKQRRSNEAQLTPVGPRPCGSQQPSLAGATSDAA